VRRGGLRPPELLERLPKKFFLLRSAFKLLLLVILREWESQKIEMLRSAQHGKDELRQSAIFFVTALEGRSLAGKERYREKRGKLKPGVSRCGFYDQR